ncbi:MAG: hypothetical protein BA865_10055 [Desulfobacterales bacterium S5133MH4]|nr:MAG: hypothetical protein BA865_10055 [Desulfobacterales bacterium S5133MH4]
MISRSARAGRLTPIHQFFNQSISDFPFRFQHLEDFMSEQIFQIVGIRRWANHKRTVPIKAAIRRHNMEVKRGLNAPEANDIGFATEAHTDERNPYHLSLFGFYLQPAIDLARTSTVRCIAGDVSEITLFAT